LVTLAALVAALFTTLLAPAGAAHATAYRFWGYYQLKDGSWAFAQKGPDQVTPKDGSVEGWRFALADQKTPRFPRATPSFADVCGDTGAEDGQKRVAVVLDYGRPADGGSGANPPAARADCAVVDTAASGAEVLAAVAQVRSDKALICAVDGYPETGCGGEVKDVPAAAKSPDRQVALAGLAGESAASAAPSASATPSGAPSAAPSATAGAPDQASAASSTSAQEDSGSSNATWVGFGIAILIVAALALVAAQRRRNG
ncbi:MAG TPA: SCO2322 family protein, partial [Segeticoccus sp.]|nr:SCO2322 family protein [Segeticoccus sp.]